MMARAIDADALDVHSLPMDMGGCVLIDDVTEMIANAPTIEAEPVKRGKWVIDGDCTHCSECRDVFGCTIMGYFTPKHCPNCGARMDGDSE